MRWSLRPNPEWFRRCLLFARMRFFDACCSDRRCPRLNKRAPAADYAAGGCDVAARRNRVGTGPGRRGGFAAASRWSRSRAHVRCSRREPIGPNTGPMSRRAPLGRTCHDQRSTVPAGVDLKVRVPLNSAAAIVVVEAIRCGRSNAVYSIRISTGRRPDPTAARNRLPTPIGPVETLSENTMSGLYVGSFRWSATKSKTSSTGRRIRTSPRICVMVLSFLVTAAVAVLPVRERGPRPSAGPSPGCRTTGPAAHHRRWR